MKKFKVESWFLKSLAAGHADRTQVLPSCVVEATTPQQAQEVYAARFQIPRDYYSLPRAQVDGGRGRRPIPICQFRVEEARR